MKFAVITDDNVKSIYRLENVFSFPAGEQSKTRETKQALEDALLEKGYSSDTVIVGLGGGVVCDMAGFLAATFCRGVPLVLVPTTLLAVVDASIGGKNGVNTPLGKNMIGTLRHPSKVLVDLRFLRTLPEKEIYNGRVEMLKAFLLAAPELLDVEYEKTIFAAIEIKRRIVAQGGAVRHLLNLGHTVGHALETLSGYTMSHGQAVAAGLVVEACLSWKMGVLDEASWRRIASLFPHPQLPHAPEEIVSAMELDKKSERGTPCFAMLERLGRPASFGGRYCKAAPEKLLLEVLGDFALCPCPHP